MSRRFITMAAGGLALALASTPVAVLRSQVIAPGTNPRGTDTTKTSTSGANPTTPQPTNPAAVRAEINTDLPFLQAAASANLMEIQLGQLAQTKASNSAVKEFGKRMVTDHNRLEQQVSSLTSRNGIPFKPALNSEGQQNVSQLQNLSGDQFDKAYMSMMIQAHQRDVIDFQNQSQSANSAQVRELASNSLPILREHLTQAQQVGTRVGAPTTPTVATTGNVATTAAPAAGAGKASPEIKADKAFIQVNAANNYMEVLLARLALQRAHNKDVKAYAERVNREHNRLQDEWVKVAQDNSVPLNSGSMGKNHREKLTQLEKTSDKDFDREFMNLMIDTHKDYANSMEKQSRTAHSAQVRNIAQSSLPTLRDLFHEAKRVGGEVGASTDVKLKSES
jgi:putative membrane protein